MSEISEGDQVITPEGEYADVGFKLNEFDSNDWMVYVNGEHSKNKEYKDGELVKVDQPIRVRVSRQCYAESLVALAGGYGFEFESVSLDMILRSHACAVLNPYNRRIVSGRKVKESDYDLTYAQDLPQIEGWLEANAESEEDECDTCGGDGYITYEANRGGYEMTAECPETELNWWEEGYPDCSDDSPEPRPEDEEWREKAKEIVRTDEDNGEIEKWNELGFDLSFGMSYRRLSLILLKALDRFQSELKDVREDLRFAKINAEQNGYYLDKFKEERDNLQEQIEEARKKLADARAEGWKDVVEGKESDKKKLKGLINDTLEMLFSDSDDGDGCS